jgi:putative phage-type endonuclease
MTDSFTKSQEWIDQRLKSIGGSEIASVMNRNPYKTAWQLWAEKTRRVKPEDISHLPHVVRGHLSESVARDRYERETLKSYRPKSWVHPEYSYMTASDDGYSVDLNQVLEIKAMGKDNHENAKKGIIPPHYLDQIQYGLMINKCVKCIFISYRVEDDDMVTIEVFPDVAHQKELEAAAKTFWNLNVLADVPPPRTDKDYTELKVPELDKMLLRYRELKETIDAASEEQDRIKELIKPYTKQYSHIRNAKGYTIALTQRENGYDYKKYIEKKGISEDELKEFKKKPSPVLTIRCPQVELP